MLIRTCDTLFVEQMTRSNVLRRRVKQEGPSPETTSSCVDFRTELAWQVRSFTYCPPSPGMSEG